ncbi:peptidylprolyl isomerase [Mycolicibacter senuensis]|uniref:Peptidyl-prolyl cis-trans isomerase n=1 Tax=Mycolicibacter senuensis TaxID=386913 RepID=A0A7I9XGX8_9MYCO|nr:peptidylprolyl isomerase [Mycolicibacter senuensis]MDQ2626973.1 peptidylprolyl isomerase [Actinomycetota bacterium]ORW65619.1 peptidylprolyl isomerase [Mycolicibacter senuensis]GFG69204.1 peptidyl-prolyl cis-trans isomerase [Mycolicibacter senuensis]
MSTNEERRAQAKRKLDEQVQQRAEAATKQRRILMIAGGVVAVALLAGVVFVVLRDDGDSGNVNAAPTSEVSDAPAPSPGEPGQLPKFTASPTLGADCQYPKARPASKPVEPPRSGKVPTEPAEVSVSMMTDQGPIGLMLDNAQSPCTVNSFISLGAKDFFAGTQCHRLTTSPMLSVLQCGDPAGDGTGGPGYEFANEYPTDQYAPNDPAAQQPVTYPRGTLAMANAGPGTNGSQFFLVYQDSMLPPQYTVFGKIQDDGLATLDKIAEAGVAPGGRSTDDGPPATKVTIKSVRAD